MRVLAKYVRCSAAFPRVMAPFVRAVACVLRTGFLRDCRQATPVSGLPGVSGSLLPLLSGFSTFPSCSPEKIQYSELVSV